MLERREEVKRTWVNKKLLIFVKVKHERAGMMIKRLGLIKAKVRRVIY